MLQILNVKKTLVNVINFCAREKKKALRENYVNFFISLPWKKKPTREKILRSVREKFRPPVKNSKKVCVKAIFHPWKKSKKGPKKLSRALLIFTGKKKHCTQTFIVKWSEVSEWLSESKLVL